MPAPTAAPTAVNAPSGSGWPSIEAVATGAALAAGAAAYLMPSAGAALGRVAANIGFSVGERTLLGVLAARGVSAAMGGVAGARLGAIGAAGGFVAGALAGPAVVDDGLSATLGLITAYPKLLAHIAGSAR